MLLISAHLETGHYFNPHAQRIIEGKLSGAKIAVIDTRLSNTASRADYWLSSWPGSEPAILLAMANVILQEDRYNRDFMEKWLNWQLFMRTEHPDAEATFEISLPPSRNSILRSRRNMPTREWRGRCSHRRHSARDCGGRHRLCQSRVAQRGLGQ